MSEHQVIVLLLILCSLLIAVLAVCINWTEATLLTMLARFLYLSGGLVIVLFDAGLIAIAYRVIRHLTGGRV